MIGEILQLVLLVLLVACAVLVAMMKNLIACTLILGAFSLILALEFYLLQAPDVAIAEASVGAAVSTGVYILAVRATRQK
jgi:energy-converting hydrogenase B subunit D